MPAKLRTLTIAKQNQETTYHGCPCKHCGDTLKYTMNRRCVPCKAANQRQYSQTDKGKEYFRKYFEGKGYHKKYFQTPSGRIAHQVAGNRNRVKRKNVVGSYTTQEWLTLKESYGNICLCCRKHEWELDGPLQQDHVIPVTKGGTNWISNIQPLCKTCNGMSGKGTKSTDYRDSYFEVLN
jgi:HNH endonuclease